MTCHHLITPTRGLVPCVKCTGTWPGQLLFKQPGLPSDSWLFKVHENFVMQKLCTLRHIMIILTITPPITLLTEIQRKPTLLLIFKVLYLTASFYTAINTVLMLSMLSPLRYHKIIVSEVKELVLYCIAHLYFVLT